MTLMPLSILKSVLKLNFKDENGPSTVYRKISSTFFWFFDDCRCLAFECLKHLGESRFQVFSDAGLEIFNLGGKASLKSSLLLSASMCIFVDR